MPRPDVSEERKTQILAAAAAVFERHGVRDSTMEDIVEESELSKGGVYWYFASKDELVAALVERVCEAAVAKLRHLAQLGGSAIERLQMMGRAMSAEIRKITRIRAVTLEFYALAARDTRVRAEVRKYFAHTVKLLATILRQGIERGEFSAIDPRQTAVTIAAQYEGLMLMWVVNPAAFDLEETCRHATRFILDSIVKHRGS